MGGLPLPGVVMTGLTGNPVTDTEGVYSGTEAVDWSGTVTPVLAGYTFFPISNSYSHLTADQTAQNYAATHMTFTISGAVTSNSIGVPGVTLAGLPGSPVTGADGSYTATVNYGFSGTVTPTHAQYTFDPASRTYTNVTANHLAEGYIATEIVVPTITVTSPNGGESWSVGTTHAITWTQTGLTGAVTIDLYKGGVFQKVLGTRTLRRDVRLGDRDDRDGRYRFYGPHMADQCFGHFGRGLCACASCRPRGLQQGWAGRHPVALLRDWWLQRSFGSLGMLGWRPSRLDTG